MLAQTFFSFGALQDAHAHGGVNTIEMGGKGGEGLAGRDEQRRRGSLDDVWVGYFGTTACRFGREGSDTAPNWDLTDWRLGTPSGQTLWTPSFEKGSTQCLG